MIGVYRPDFAARMLEASTAAGIETPLTFYRDVVGLKAIEDKAPPSLRARRRLAVRARSPRR